MSASRQQVIALVLAGIFPGLGQFYNRQPVKGAVFFAVGAIASWLLGRAMPTDLLALEPLAPALIVPLVILLVIWIWSAIDAWVAGRR